MKLRYTGAGPVTLVTLGIEVEPGGEIEVADGAGAAFADRPDFERPGAPPEEQGAGVGDEPSDAGQGAQTPPARRKTKTAGSDAADAQHADEPAPTA